MPRSLIETITDKAKVSFALEVDWDNYEVWRQHWIKTGETWRDELFSQGLLQTSAKLTEIVDEEKNRQSLYAASFAWANFCKMVYYGYSSWPSYSYWIVPGTITNEERV